MAKKNFILMSLEDKETKKIANVVSNDSCKKILDYLAEHDNAIESEIAKELKIPISTAHYNLKQLMEVGLVLSDEFHYSPKGKEVRHYQIANKYIIITPQKTKGIKDIIKNIMPAFLVSLGVSFALFMTAKLNTLFNRDNMVMSAQTFGAEAMEKTGAGGVRALTSIEPLMESAPQVMDAAVNEGAQAVMANGTQSAVDAVNQTAQEITRHAVEQQFIFQEPSWLQLFFYRLLHDPSIALWFFAGAVFTAVVYISLMSIRNKGKEIKGKEIKGKRVK
jgi:predicted transcriptional regulator